MGLAPRLLYMRASGGYSGPASRSGVPLEHPPYHQFPAWLQGESKDTPCPAMYSRQFPGASSQSVEVKLWKLETGNCTFRSSFSVPVPPESLRAGDDAGVRRLP